MKNRKFIVFSLLACAAVVVFAAVFASSYPDGLEQVASKMGFENKMSGINLMGAPMPDYGLALFGAGPFSTLVAGLSGLAAVFLATTASGWAIKRLRRSGNG